MLETNIRIVRPGNRLYVSTRFATVSGSNITSKLLEKACNTLRYRCGVAAVPYSADPPRLLVAIQKPLESINLADEEWELTIKDANQTTQRLLLNSQEGNRFLPALIERAFLAHIASSTDLWTLDSPRIWYEAQPFRVEDGIAVFRGYEISTVDIDDVGIGIAVDVRVSFFSAEPLAYYFDPSVGDIEGKRREALFARLAQRQSRHKGTLVYDNGRKKTKCYFVSPPMGMTCGTTGSLRIKGQSYESLLAYYKATNPDMAVDGSTLAVRVSFSNLSLPQPVAADHVRVRIANESVPMTLQNVDKIKPDVRRKLINDFWRYLGDRPLGFIAPGVESSFWRPRSDEVVQFAMPVLTFGKDKTLFPPDNFTDEAYKEHFRQRLRCLQQYGCFHVPPNITRTLYCAYPKHLSKESVEVLATDLANTVNRLTGKPISASLIDYENIGDAIEKLRDTGQSGMAVFILNDQPEAYYEVEFHLSGWRIKRITEATIEEQYAYLTSGAWDRRLQTTTADAGQKLWAAFVAMNAFDVIQLLDVTPYRIDQTGSYESQLTIDVGRDRRHFAVSLLIARKNIKKPEFWFASHTQPKTDHHQETINPVILADEIIALFRRLPRHFEPLSSILVMRDGRIVGQEPEGIEKAISQLKEMGYLERDAQADLVDLRKESLKGIRIWDVSQDSSISNPLVGSGIRLNKNMLIMATTGRPTLSQGTAEPVMVINNGQCPNLMNAAQAFFAGAQLNWSSPRVAQRLHIGMKRTDDDLKTRFAQEIRRLR
jgi:hypothetical protein